MDVVNLREGGENSELSTVCVVTDDINEAISEHTRHFTMHVCFIEKTTVISPFMLLFISKEREEALTRLDANFVLENAHRMWDERDNEAPFHDRNNGESIRLDFYRSTHGISFSWTDIYPTKDGELPTPIRVRGLKMQDKDKKMGLYLFLNLEQLSSVRVMTDSAFGSFLTLRCVDPLVKLECCACKCTLETGATSWVNFECGHMMCEYCHNNTSTEGPPQCQYKEPIKTFKATRTKIRHGPCPIDCCNKNTDKGGTILVPCGCYIQCRYLRNAYEKYKQNLRPLINDLQHCPYEVCRKKVENMLFGRDEH